VLYVVMLGGKHPKAKIEVHDVVFGIGDTLEQIYPQLRQQWYGASVGLHIDSWLMVDGVAEYQVRFSDVAPGADEPRLFFINLGGYNQGQFGEDHLYLLVVANDKASAKRQGKAIANSKWQQPHVDNLLDVDDCLPIDHVDGRYIRLIAGPHNGMQLQNDYIVLS
jgi:hypothetical protein